MEGDGFAGRWCMALPIFVQTVEGPRISLAAPLGLALFLQDLDRRAKTEIEFHVASPNLWLPVPLLYVQLRGTHRGWAETSHLRSS